MTTSQLFFTDDEIKQTLDRQKILLGELSWMEDPTHSRYQIARFLVADEDGATIPGLTVEFDFRRGDIAEDCKFSFTIFGQRGGGRRRIFQIEVVPQARRSHNGPSGALYGPHQHFGEDTQPIDTHGLGCGNHEEWVREFLRRANIGWGGVYSPPIVQGDLF